jgi:hypothetical protein
MPQTGFVVQSEGPQPLVGILEDADETAWLYLYDHKMDKILATAPAYNRSEEVQPTEDDV